MGDRGEKRRGGKKALGANVDNFLKREDQIDQALDYVKVMEHNTNIAKWSEKRYRMGLTAEIDRRGQAEQLEFEMASHELKVRRREKLSELYENLNLQYEQELNDRGLAFVRNRD